MQKNELRLLNCTKVSKVAVTLKRKRRLQLMQSLLSSAALLFLTMRPELGRGFSWQPVDLHCYMGNVRFPTCCVVKEGIELFQKPDFRVQVGRAAVSHIVCYTQPQCEVFVCEYVCSSRSMWTSGSQIHLYKCWTVSDWKHSARPEGWKAPPWCTIPEAPSAGGKRARCSHPLTRRRSAGWSCTERCTLGSTGSAWAAADTFHRSPQIWSGEHKNRSTLLWRRRTRGSSVTFLTEPLRHNLFAWNNHYKLRCKKDYTRRKETVKGRTFCLVSPLGRLRPPQGVSRQNQGNALKNIISYKVICQAFLWKWYFFTCNMCILEKTKNWTFS